jgi:hypothetical protein
MDQLLNHATDEDVVSTIGGGPGRSPIHPPVVVVLGQHRGWAGAQPTPLPPPSDCLSPRRHGGDIAHRDLNAFGTDGAQALGSGVIAPHARLPGYIGVPWRGRRWCPLNLLWLRPAQGDGRQSVAGHVTGGSLRSVDVDAANTHEHSDTAVQPSAASRSAHCYNSQAWPLPPSRCW